MADLSNIVHTYEVIAPHLGFWRALDTAWQPEYAAGCGRNDPEIKLCMFFFLDIQNTPIRVVDEAEVFLCISLSSRFLREKEHKNSLLCYHKSILLINMKKLLFFFMFCL